MNLKIARIRKELTQEELAKKSGISRKLISKAENGDYSKLNYEKMEKLARVLEVSIETLFFSSGDIL